MNNKSKYSIKTALINKKILKTIFLNSPTFSEKPLISAYFYGGNKTILLKKCKKCNLNIKELKEKIELTIKKYKTYFEINIWDLPGSGTIKGHCIYFVLCPRCNSIIGNYSTIMFNSSYVNFHNPFCLTPDFWKKEFQTDYLKITFKFQIIYNDFFYKINYKKFNLNTDDLISLIKLKKSNKKYLKFENELKRYNKKVDEDLFKYTNYKIKPKNE